MAEDEQVASSVTEEESEQGNSSAETEKTEDGPKPNYVPQSRLNEMAAKKREAESRIAELEARLASIDTSDVKKEDLPGEEGSMEQVKFLVEKYAKPLADKRAIAVIEEKFGMPIEKVKDRLDRAEKAEAISQWRAMCMDNGVDYKDKEIQGIVQGLSTIGDLTMEDALKRAIDLTGSKSKKRGARAETDGVTGVDTTSDWIPKDLKDALDGAHKGKRSKHLSSVEIIEQRKARQRGS